MNRQLRLPLQRFVDTAPEGSRIGRKFNNNIRKADMRAMFLGILLGMPFAAGAVTIKGDGRGPTEPESQRQAMAALAEAIFVDVQSEFTIRAKRGEQRESEHVVRSRADLPLIGVEVSGLQIGDAYLSTALLDSDKSLHLYLAKLDDLRREIAAIDEQIDKVKGTQLHALLSDLITLIDQYEKYRTVARMLGEEKAPPAAHTRTAVQERIRALEARTPTLALAARVISEGIETQNLYVFPAMPRGSHEVTSLGRMLKDQIATRLSTVERPEQASHLFKGEYEITKDAIHLTYRLLDAQGNTLKTRIATLAPEAYREFEYQPKSLSFDRLLHEGMVVSSDFRVELNTNRGREDLMFEENDEVELLVKMTRPGYFYVVGHVVKSAENYSYLLELGEGDGARRFIHYVNGDEVNKWISLGKFEAAAPFGVESLQVVAANEDPVQRLPDHRYDAATGLYFVASNANEGVVKTRALRPIRDERKKKYSAETVLMFTSAAQQRR